MLVKVYFLKMVHYNLIKKIVKTSVKEQERVKLDVMKEIEPYPKVHNGDFNFPPEVLSCFLN